MTLGFILIRVVPRQEHDVLAALQAVPEIEEVHSLLGDHDVIAKMGAANSDQLGHAVVAKVRSIPGVAATRTLAAGPL